MGGSRTERILRTQLSDTECLQDMYGREDPGSLEYKLECVHASNTGYVWEDLSASLASMKLYWLYIHLCLLLGILGNIKPFLWNITEM